MKSALLCAELASLTLAPIEVPDLKTCLDMTHSRFFSVKCRNNPTIRTANAIVAIAGMEGALGGVIAGLVSVPVVAVPTSVGYGASFGGIAPLLTMLNSCAEGMSVVNIDNGFGAGYLAARINRLAVQGNRT